MVNEWVQEKRFSDSPSIIEIKSLLRRATMVAQTADEILAGYPQQKMDRGCCYSVASRPR